jgi:hypothetical protein
MVRSWGNPERAPGNERRVWKHSAAREIAHLSRSGLWKRYTTTHPRVKIPSPKLKTQTNADSRRMSQAASPCRTQGIQPENRCAHNVARLLELCGAGPQARTQDHSRKEPPLVHSGRHPGAAANRVAVRLHGSLPPAKRLSGTPRRTQARHTLPECSCRRANPRGNGAGVTN